MIEAAPKGELLISAIQNWYWCSRNTGLYVADERCEERVLIRVGINFMFYYPESCNVKVGDILIGLVGAIMNMI